MQEHAKFEFYDNAVIFWFTCEIPSVFSLARIKRIFQEIIQVNLISTIKGKVRTPLRNENSSVDNNLIATNTDIFTVVELCLLKLISHNNLIPIFQLSTFVALLTYEYWVK